LFFSPPAGLALRRPSITAPSSAKTALRSLSRCPEGALMAAASARALMASAPPPSQQRHQRVAAGASAAATSRRRGSYSSSTTPTTIARAGSPMSSLDGGSASSSASAAATAAAAAAAAAAAEERQAQEAELITLAETLPKQDSGLGGIALWLGAAVAFGVGVYATMGSDKGEEYFAGYLLEQSLSVDNLFVFVLVFRYFRTPPEGQASALSWGIGTAAVLRLVMILLGAELIDVWRPVLLVFAAALVYSAWGLSGAGNDDDEDDDDLSDNSIVRFCRRFLPVTDHYDGANFFTTAGKAREIAARHPPFSDAPGGPPPLEQVAASLAIPSPSLPDTARVATPLLLTLAVIELSDVVFAVDSIPAVFGVTTDPFIVYTSNLFAIVSLRAVYKFVSGMMTDLKYLDKALAFVLAFIGLKLVGEFFGAEVPTAASLGIVGGALATGVAASLWLPDDKGDKEEDEKE
jgi:TerC family integral membrane protein